MNTLIIKTRKNIPFELKQTDESLGSYLMPQQHEIVYEMPENFNCTAIPTILYIIMIHSGGRSGDPKSVYPRPDNVYKCASLSHYG